MSDIISDIRQLRLRISRLKADNIVFSGVINSLSTEDISTLKSISEYIVDSYLVKNNSSISIEDNISQYVGENVFVEIKTGDIANYYETFFDFVSGNKFSITKSDYYIAELDYLDGESSPPRELIDFQINLQLIDFLIELSDYKKEIGNSMLELFFYKNEKGVTIKINYDVDDFKNIKIKKIKELEEQVVSGNNSIEKRKLFVYELIAELSKSGETYVNVIKKWDIIVENFERSYNLYLSGFSFEKIKTSSIEHFHKLTDRIYETISKVSSYLFGIPIGYILLINNFDFSGKNFGKNFALLLLGIAFFSLIWSVFFKNIKESIKAIEKDIDKFLDKIKGNADLSEIVIELRRLKNKSVKKQKKKLNIVKACSVIILIITIGVFCYIHKGIFTINPH